MRRFDTIVWSCALALLPTNVQSRNAHPPPVSVAVVGAGAAGSSTAYHLDKFAADYGIDLKVTIFERELRPGGRTTTVNAYDDPDQPVEVGGSIFVEVNKILMDAAKDFNLTMTGFQAQHADIPGPELGVWDGEKFVFILDGRNSWWDKAKMIYRYGLAPVSTIRLMKATVGKFLKMYDEPIFPWSSLTQAAQDVDLLGATAATGEEYMANNNIVGDFVDEIVQASTRVNYAQNMKHIHGLEAMVCMAAEGAYSVEKGNWLIFDNMVTASQATKRFGTIITDIRRHGKSYSVESTSTQDGDPVAESFDNVVLAVPYQYAGIKFSPEPAHVPDEIPYVRLHVTLFTSSHLLSTAYFNLSVLAVVPRSVLTTLPPDEEPRQGSDGCGSPGFWSISLLRTLTNPKTGEQEYLYKIFSPKPISDTFINRILDHAPQREGLQLQDVTWIYRKEWNSYPYELPRVTFEEIQLDEGLWYTSGIESFISTMETSALMGKNVAKLAVNEIRDKLIAQGYALPDPQVKSASGEPPKAPNPEL